MNDQANNILFERLEHIIQEGGFLLLVQMPLYISFMICSLILIIGLWRAKQVRMYKIINLILSSAALPVIGIIMMLLSLAITAVLVLYVAGFFLFIFPVLASVGFYFAAKLYISKAFLFLDDSVIYILSGLMATIGSPSIGLVWTFFVIWREVS